MIFACNKAEQGTGEEENNNNGGGGGGGEQTSYVVINSISAQEELALDEDWNEGRVVPVELTPSSASVVKDVSVKIADESIATFSQEALGIRVKPVSVGTTTLTISPKHGPADPAVVKIKINPAGMTQMPVIKSITLSQSSVELSDLSSSGGMDEITVPFSYVSDETAGADAFYCSSNDADVSAMLVSGDKPALKVSVAPNSANSTTNVRSAKVTLRSYAGPADPAVLTVNVKGHVYSMSVSADPHAGDDGNIHIVRGESVQLYVYVQKTGELKAGDGEVIFTSDSPSRISVSKDGLITIPSSAQVTGANGNPVNVTASVNATYVSPQKVSLKTYEKPTGLSFSTMSGWSSVKGNTLNLEVSVLPSTALQEFTYDYSGDAANVTREGNTLKIKTVTATQYEDRIFITPHGGDLLSWYFSVDDYEAADVKAGDYVYYNSSKNRFYFSDAGLRADGSGWHRFEGGGSPKAPNSSLGTLIGIVYNVDVDSDIYANQVPILGSGLATDYGYGTVYFHAGVISIMDETTQDKYWSKNYVDVSKDWPSGYGNAPTMSGNNNTYQINMGIAAYNKKVSTANDKIKAFYYVTNHNQRVFNSSKDEEVIPVGGSTGWLLPCYYDVDHYILPNVDIINESLQKASSLGAKKLLADRFSYWTSTFDSDYRYAYCWGSDGIGSAYKNNISKCARLVLIL